MIRDDREEAIADSTGGSPIVPRESRLPPAGGSTESAASPPSGAETTVSAGGAPDREAIETDSTGAESSDSSGELRELLRGLVLDEDTATIEKLREEVALLRRAVEDRGRIETIVRSCIDTAIAPHTNALEAELARLLAASESRPPPPTPAALREELTARVADETRRAVDDLKEHLPEMVAATMLTNEAVLRDLLARGLTATLRACRQQPEAPSSRALREALRALLAPPGEAEPPRDASPSRTVSAPEDSTTRSDPASGENPAAPEPPAADKPGPGAPDATADGVAPVRPPTGAPATPPAAGAHAARPSLLGRLRRAFRRRDGLRANAPGDRPAVYHHRLPGRVLHTALLETDTGRLLVEATAPGEEAPDEETTQERLEVVRREILKVLIEQSASRACEVSHGEATIHVAMRDRLYLLVVMIGKPPPRFHADLQRLLDRIYRRAARQWEPIDQSPAMRSSVVHSLERFMTRAATPRRRLIPW